VHNDASMAGIFDDTICNRCGNIGELDVLTIKTYE
jgi:hypothetical protein